MIPPHEFDGSGARSHLCRICDGLESDRRHIPRRPPGGAVAPELPAELMTAEPAPGARAAGDSGDTGDTPVTAGDTPETPPSNPEETAGESDTPPIDSGDSARGAGPPAAPEESYFDDDEPGELLAAGDELQSAPAPAGRERRYYDWPEIKRRYVEGVKVGDRVEYPSLDACADHFGVAGNRVREKAAQQGWVAQRQQFQAQIEAARKAARAKALGDEAVNLDNRALEIAKQGLQLCMVKLADIGQRAQQARSQAGPGGGAKLDMIDPLEQQRLAAAVDLWHKIGLRAIGDPETLRRVEITGAGGRPIQIETELRRDDPNRLSGVIAVLAQAGLGDVLTGGAGGLAGRRAVAADRGDDGGRAALEPRR